MAITQIAGGGLERAFRHCFTEGLNQSLVLSAEQATSTLALEV